MLELQTVKSRMKTSLSGTSCCILLVFIFVLISEVMFDLFCPVELPGELGAIAFLSLDPETSAGSLCGPAWGRGPRLETLSP